MLAPGKTYPAAGAQPNLESSRRSFTLVLSSSTKKPALKATKTRRGWEKRAAIAPKGPAHARKTRCRPVSSRLTAPLPKGWAEYTDKKHNVYFHKANPPPV